VFSPAGPGPSVEAQDSRLHRRLHVSKLGESGKREKIFASAAGASLSIKGHGIVLDLSKTPRRRSFLLFFILLTGYQQFWQKPLSRT
jgi:hypothetical protein